MAERQIDLETLLFAAERRLAETSYGLMPIAAGDLKALVERCLKAERDDRGASMLSRCGFWSARDLQTVQDAIRAYGRDAQLRQLQEEAGEVVVAVNHLARNRLAAEARLIEELADLEIMVMQARLICGPEKVDAMRAHKLERVRERLSVARRELGR